MHCGMSSLSNHRIEYLSNLIIFSIIYFLIKFRSITYCKLFDDYKLQYGQKTKIIVICCSRFSKNAYYIKTIPIYNYYMLGRLSVFIFYSQVLYSIVSSFTAAIWYKIIFTRLDIIAVSGVTIIRCKV